MLALGLSWFIGRHRKENSCGMHKILPSDYIVSSIPDEQVFDRKGKYINDPLILKEVTIIDVFYRKISRTLELDKSKLKMHHPLNIVHNLCIYIYNNYEPHVVSCVIA